MKDMKTADARAFADASYSYTGAEVRLWVHDMADLIDELRAALDATGKQSVPALSGADSQKLSEARQLAHNMVSHPVAFSTIDHVEEAGNTIMELLAALDAAQAPREVPRLTDEQIEAGFHRGWGLAQNLDDFVTGARWAESRVRELCGVAP